MTQKWVLFSAIGALFLSFQLGIAHAQVEEERFEKNVGQWQEEVLFKGAGSGSTVSFLENGLSFVAGREVEGASSSSEERESNSLMGDEYEYLIWNLEFQNSLPHQVIGESEQPGKSNYFPDSDPAHHFTHVPECAAVLYVGLYAGIDLRWYRQGVQLKYDFLLAPGTDAGQIALAYQGIDGLALTSAGRLEVETNWGIRAEEKPVAYQWINGQKVLVPCTYRLLNDTTFGFDLQGADPDFPVVIDPLVLVWSTFAGATVNSANNYAYDVAVDDQGFVYVCGKCDGSFPVTPTAYDTSGIVGQETAFVRKYTPDGTALVYSTYLGSSLSAAWSLAVNDQGEVFVTGGQNGVFPVTAGAYLDLPVGSSGFNVFLTHLNANGDGLLYSSRFGGSNTEVSRAVAVNDQGEAYLTGITTSADFPTTGGAFAGTLRGSNDAFVFKMNAAGTAPVYSTYFGGDNIGTEEGRDLALDNAGRAVICGNTQSSANLNFPITPGAWQTTRQGSTEGFVTKFNSNGNGLIFSSFITGNAGESVEALLLNSNDEPILTGYTSSSNFPVTPNVIQSTQAGVADAFVLHLTAAGDAAIKSTLWGGLAADQPYDLALRNDREVIIFGFSQASGIPTDSCAFQPDHEQGADFFITHFNQDFTGLGEAGSTYFGGMSSDYHKPAVALDTTGSRTYLVFSGTSHSTNFPTTPGSYQPAKLNQTGDQPVTFKMEIVNPRFYDTLACSLDTVQLDPGPGAFSYGWSTGDSTQSINVTNPGDYWVELAYHNCVLRDTFTLGVGVALVLGDDSLACDVDSVVLAPVTGPYPNLDYLWSTGATTQQLTVQNTGIYWLEVSDSLGCSGRDTMNVTLGETPLVSLPPDTGLCAGSSLSVNAQAGPAPAGTRWLWSTGDTIPALVLDQDTTYWVRAWDPVGCTAADTLQLSIYPLPVITLASPLNGCEGDTLFANADPNGQYPTGQFTWNTGATGPVLPITISGAYTVSLLDANGCPDTASLQATLFPYPVIDLGPDQTVCEPAPPIVLNPDPNGTLTNVQFLWSDQSTGNQLTTTQSGTWWVQVTGQGGCATADTVQLTFVPVPLVELGPDLALCENDSLELVPNADPGLSFNWSTGATTPTIWVTQPGLYAVNVLSPEGCPAADSIALSLIPRFELDLGPDIEQCFIEPIELNTGLNGVDFTWSTGSGAARIEVKGSGLYWVEAVNQCQTERDSISVEFLTDQGYPFIPSAFTPNGDDLNETFFVTWGDPDQSDFELRIYNRWGVLFFHTFDPQQAWDGTYDGQPAQEGVYVYRFFARDCQGKRFEKKGTVTLLR